MAQTAKNKAIRVSDRTYGFLSGFTNLKAGANLELIVGMMEHENEALPLFMKYLNSKDEAMKCALEKLEMFEDYILVKKDTIKDMKRKLATKEYQARKKKETSNDEPEMSEAHARYHKEIALEHSWIDCGNSKEDRQMKPWIADAMSHGIDEANRKYVNGDYD